MAVEIFRAPFSRQSKGYQFLESSDRELKKYWRDGNRLFFRGGGLTLIQAVLSSLPMYCLSLFKIEYIIIYCLLKLQKLLVDSSELCYYVLVCVSILNSKESTYIVFKYFLLLFTLRSYVGKVMDWSS